MEKNELDLDFGIIDLYIVYDQIEVVINDDQFNQDGEYIICNQNSNEKKNTVERIVE